MITASAAVEKSGLLDELRFCLTGESVRLQYEQAQVRDLSPFVEQLKRSDPDIVFIDVGSLRGSISPALQKIRAITGVKSVKSDLRIVVQKK